MAITNKTRRLIEQVQKMLDISDIVVASSKYLTQEEKQWEFKVVNDTRNSLHELQTQHNAYLNVANVRSVANVFLVRWNEDVSIDVERFWDEVSRCKLEFKRAEPLQFALQNGHFRNIHVIMAARKNWEDLLSSELIGRRYTQAEIEKLRLLMTQDEMHRVELFRKCLNAGRIPDSQVLRFCDTDAYFTRLNIMQRHFSPIEIMELHRLRSELK